MPFYLITQKTPTESERLVEGDKPASALNHVIDSMFTVRKVENRELLDAVKRLGDPEVAGAPVVEPEPEPEVEPVVTNGQPVPRDEGNAPLPNEPYPAGHDEFGAIDN